jgi:hypothetical protein
MKFDWTLFYFVFRPVSAQLICSDGCEPWLDPCGGAREPNPTTTARDCFPLTNNIWSLFRAHVSLGDTHKWRGEEYVSWASLHKKEVWIEQQQVLIPYCLLPLQGTSSFERVCLNIGHYLLSIASLCGWWPVCWSSFKALESQRGVRILFIQVMFQMILRVQFALFIVFSCVSGAVYEPHYDESMASFQSNKHSITLLSTLIWVLQSMRQYYRPLTLPHSRKTKQQGIQV